MRRPATGEIEHISFRINLCLLEAVFEFSLFSVCFGWILNYFREQQWNTYCSSGIVLTSGDAKVKKPSGGLHIVLETDREKAMVSEICNGSTEKRVSSSSGKVLSWILKHKICLFLQRGEGVPGEWHVQNHGIVMMMSEVQGTMNIHSHRRYLGRTSPRVCQTRWQVCVDSHPGSPRALCP